MAEDVKANDKGDQAQTGKDSQEPQQIPYARFKEKVDEVNGLKGSLGELQRQMAELQSANKAQEDVKLAEQGKYKELTEKQKAEIDRLKALEGRIVAYDEKLKALNDERRKSIPENLQDLIPSFSSPMDEFDYLTKFNSKIGELKGIPGQPPTGAKPGGAGAEGDEIAALEKALTGLENKSDQISSAQRVALINKIHQLKKQR